MKNLKLNLTTILTLVVVSLLSISSSEVFAGGKFTSAEQFTGSYVGSMDGRKATLLISRVRSSNPAPMFRIRMADKERNTTYYATKEHKDGDHVLRDIILKTTNGKSKYIKKLYLHTWNTDYISGYSTWNGKYYGCSFARQKMPSTSLQGKRFSNSADFYGTYEGYTDGRKARLIISKVGYATSIKLIDLSRNVTFGTTTQSMPIKVGSPHILESLDLIGSNKDSKKIGRLYLHTWNTNYISGNTIWNGQKFGILFTRVK